tara:strand:- start:5306 stop:5524 length:219 start_codon:yes stop_codon:yes gene_type:complete
MAARKKQLPEPVVKQPLDADLLVKCKHALVYMMEKCRWEQLSTKLYLAGDPECNYPDQVLEDLKERLGDGEL